MMFSLHTQPFVLDRPSGSYTTLMDPNGVASGEYWVNALPSAFLISSGGVVKYHFIGAFNTVNLASQLQGLGVSIGQ